MLGFFVTGTDTGIGKTYFTLACIRALQSHGITTTAMKPVASGAQLIDGQLRNADALQIQQELKQTVDYELINPYCFEPAVSPHIAATQAGVSIELELIKQGYDRLCTEADYAIVEGVGGWLAPLSNDYSVADLARAIGLPVVIVVGIRLGCLNHARLTRQAIDTSGVSLAGWVANCFEAEISAIDEQIAYLTQALAMPPLAIMGRHQANIAINSLPGLAI